MTTMIGRVMRTATIASVIASGIVACPGISSASTCQPAWQEKLVQSGALDLERVAARCSSVSAGTKYRGKIDCSFASDLYTSWITPADVNLTRRSGWCTNGAVSLETG